MHRFDFILFDTKMPVELNAVKSGCVSSLRDNSEARMGCATRLFRKLPSWT